MKHSNKIKDSNNREGKKVRVLFVCLGNICRSPGAEGIMKQLIEDHELQDFIEVDSAGTSGWHEGDLPDERMRAHGAKRGYDFLSRARRFRKRDLDKFDYIIVMDSSNYTNVKSLASTKEQLDKIHMMTDYSQQYNHDHVPDPYYGGASGFELVLDLLEDATEGLLQAIKEKHAFA
ncbi:MAG: low molecular weight protein-tyrosine-phosphatase [Bacteroidota bacterium]|jgi:protein-tyrosine phosphatase|nr:low molecular weight protein-tyrosine-phosphatase [Bacteroidota bacterium]HHU96187.1 low molecular weight phosphotyrosine protein phosphatase [Petrimonas sp.]